MACEISELDVESMVTLCRGTVLLMVARCICYSAIERIDKEVCLVVCKYKLQILCKC